jgi:ABC-type multidrug transport system, ATPase component
MIQVENLTKYYGPIRGIEDITFTIDKGEVVGLLGPNGSGKTTTMRILTGFFPPTSGRALINGYDVTKKPLEVQRHTGYFPEKAPLYPDMSVTDYLGFVGKVKGIKGEKRKEQIDKVMVTCGIGEIADRLIGKLSKGFRQRVCLAQALLNDPDILVLDEPTIGLDPRQVVEVRKLIKNLSRERTVILCTHILPEVSETCDRVIIIHKGKLIAMDTPKNLQEKIQKYTQTLFQYYGGNGGLGSELMGLPGVINVERKEPNFSGAQALVIQSEKDEATLRAISTFITQHGGPIMEMKKISLTLEEVFLELVTEEEL